MSDLFYFFIYFRCYVHFFCLWRYDCSYQVYLHVWMLISMDSMCIPHKGIDPFAPVFFLGTEFLLSPKSVGLYIFIKNQGYVSTYGPQHWSLNLQFWSSKLTRPIWPCCQQIATLLRFHTSFWDRKLICLVPYFLEAITWISLRTCSMMRTFLAWYIIYWKLKKGGNVSCSDCDVELIGCPVWCSVQKENLYG